jgi:RHS repeat-associated protein
MGQSAGFGDIGVWTGENYRFGFNGQEMDNEISGQTGTHTTAIFWEYDARLGRRWNVDPLSKLAAGWSPYRAFFCNPILYSDPFGLFETRKEARQYRRENGLRGKINYNKSGGYYSIDDNRSKTSYWKSKESLPANTIGYNSETGVITATGAYSKRDYFHDSNPYKSHVMRQSWENNVDNPMRDVGMISVGVYPGRSKWMEDFNRGFGTLLNVGIAAPAAGELVVAPLLETAVEAAVVTKAAVIEHLVYTELMTGNVSLIMDSPYIIGTVLRHTNAGKVVVTLILANSPEGLVTSFQSYYFLEQAYKFLKELVEQNPKEADEWWKEIQKANNKQ